VLVCSEHREAAGLESELEWMSEMTEDEYNELTPRTQLEVDRIRLHLNKQRLKKYSDSFTSSCSHRLLLCACSACSYASATHSVAARGIMFSNTPSVRACVRVCICT